MSPAVVHLQPTGPVAPRVLLPGDPGRALALAQVLLEAPRMSNHARGLWGYTGLAADGLPLTIQATGIGGPSAALVLEELADLGAEVVIRTGTARALVGALVPGDLLAVTGALPDDGTSRALGATARLEADPALAAALGAATGRSGLLASCDLVRDPAAGGRAAVWADAGVVAVDLETAALLAVGRARGVRVAAVVAIAEAAGERLDADGLARAGVALGRAASRALGLPERAAA